VHPSDKKKAVRRLATSFLNLALQPSLESENCPCSPAPNNDVITRVSGHTLLVECKRPQSKKGVRRSIEDATGQLLTHFKNYNRRVIPPRGLIVLDISIVTNLQRIFLTSDSIEAIVTETNALIARFHAEFKSALGYRRDERILGILTFAKFLGYDRLENNHSPALLSQKALTPFV
jgi:hypothetical protein